MINSKSIHLTVCLSLPKENQISGVVNKKKEIFILKEEFENLKTELTEEFRNIKKSFFQ